MQAGSSILLHNILESSFQSLKHHHGFHTSACVLARPKKFSFRASTTRTSARKRLVPSLKDGTSGGNYEVAPRQFDSGDHSNKSQLKSKSKSKKIQVDHIKQHPPPSQRRKLLRGRSDDKLPWTNGHSRDSDYNKGPPRSAPVEAPWQKNVSSASSNKEFSASSMLTREAAPHESRAASETRKRYEAFAHKHSRVSHHKRPSQAYTVAGNINAPAGPSWQEQANKIAVNSDDSQLISYPSKTQRPEHEFELDTPVEPMKTLPPRFSSPPLLEGLLKSVHEVLGPTTKATAIQSLSLKHLFAPPAHISQSEDDTGPPSSPVWNQYLLASETGSGKSIAYLLPMIQYLKLTENLPAPLPDSAPPLPSIPMSISPRGLILAPTHELSRQLSSFAKALIHNVRLRVMCTSQANTLSSSRGRNSTASQLKRELDTSRFGITGEETRQFNNKRERPIDILVSTPARILEMTRGWGWDKADKIEDDWDEARKERARKWVPGKPEASLALIEWVVVDEADILFDNDFQETTRLLLADIARARGYDHPSFSSLKTTFLPSPGTPNTMLPIVYPFNLVLTSATIPSSLSTYLSANHPQLIRLASHKLHQLPPTLKTEHYAYASGNKNADVEKRIRNVWAEDATGTKGSKARSKVLIFCNKSTKVNDLHLYLKEKGIANIPLTSDGQARLRGSNRHLAGFLKKTAKDDEEANLSSPAPPANTSTDPHVMITTSLLSRGLDFSPQIKHVFILDEPRNMIDFLHRAGRSGRAGNEGHVVIFGRMKGRGSGNAREVKRRIGALTH